MKSILENLEKWIIYGFYLMFILTFINTCNSCSRNKDQVRLKKEIINQQKEIDSLSNEIVNEKEMKKMLDDNMWKFLELEELSDKNHIPINELKYKDKQNE